MKHQQQWLAGSNGIAHMTDPLDRWRSLCGARQVLERLAYPAVRRCLVCELRSGARDVVVRPA
jgi:hypothetical protein